MNFDSYLDPPDYDIPIPQCCGDDMDVDDDGNCKCDHCGKTCTYEDMYPPDVPDLPEPDIDFDPSEHCHECGKPNNNGCMLCDECGKNAKCRHGNPVGECDACDHEGDLAYNAARESRFR